MRQNPAKTLDDAYTGKLDTKPIKVTQECKSKVDKILQKSSEIARNLGVRGTPFFIIEGKVIQGADILRIQEALSGLQSKESK
ncbi:hypothetical protein [Thermodesulfovibrio sp. 3462-1]|uniref:DSBA-like thioredoxin domain-containing protein n=1 Tax=Thermodesulfovibrio obliviosus TaxID=3118332 RepID=A0AAU8H1V2_9BACT